MSSRNVDEMKTKYSLERMRLVFDYNREPERGAYYRTLLHALELAFISGDWPWYENMKKRALPKKQYKEFLEDELKKYEN